MRQHAGTVIWGNQIQMGQWGNVRRGGWAACVRKSRRMHGCHSGGRLIFCGLPPPAAHTSKSPGPSPKPALKPWQKNKNNNNKWAEENHCQSWAGPPWVPSPIIFCISCGLGAEMSHYVGQDARLHVVFTKRRVGAQLVLRWVTTQDLYFQAIDGTVTYDLHTYTHMKGAWPSHD